MPDDLGHSMDAGAPGEDALHASPQARDAQLRNLLAQQEALAYGLSHDLRAPLRIIEAYSALLERQSGDALDATGREHLARIRGAAAKMGALLEALLDYSRVERHSPASATVDLGLYAELALAELQEAGTGKRVQASIAPGLLAAGDERLLRLLVTQLVRNAWNFSGDELVLDMRGHRVGDVLHIAIRDNGRGFDMGQAARIFEPFQRLHLPEEGAGHGLGLAIASRVAERHGGRLRAESAPGEGSTFHLELPAAAGDAPAGNPG
ncbi:MAG: sensor histidine kinase [Luteimonas sp.]